MSANRKSVGLLLFFVFLVILVGDDSRAWETPERAENWELISPSKGRGSVDSYVKGRVICHTFETLLDLPPNNMPVDIEVLSGDALFVAMLSELGVCSVRRAFDYESVKSVNEEILFGENDFISLDHSYVFDLCLSNEIETVVEELRRNLEVMVAEFDYYIRFSSPDSLSSPGDIPKNDDYWDDQWNLFDPDNEENGNWGIGCPTAWDSIGYGEPDIRVACIEKQVEGSHIDFKIGTTSYIEGLACYEGEDGVEFSTDPRLWSSPDGHGTPVAGTFGARSFNDEGIRGIAGGNVLDQVGVTVVALCPIAGVDVGSDLYAELIVKGSDPESIGGAGCDVIGSSAASAEYTEVVRKAIIHAHERGCSFVSGKSESATKPEPDPAFAFPGDYDYSMVTCVSGYDDTGHLCAGDCAGYYTFAGKGLDILAPADSYMALESYNTYDDFSGVSGAIPHVVGAIGLLRSSSVCQNANLRPEDYQGLLKRTTCFPAISSTNSPDGCGDNLYWDEDYGYGLLRIGNAAEHITQDGHVFRSYTATDGSVCDSLASSPSEYAEYSFGGNSPPKGNFKAQVLKVLVTVNYSDDFDGAPLAWGGLAGIMGISAANPNYTKPYCVVVDGSQDKDSCDMITYVMRLYDWETGLFDRFHPCCPEDAIVRCNVSGVLADKSEAQGKGSWTSKVQAGKASIRFNSAFRSEARMLVFDVRGRLVAERQSVIVEVGDNKAEWDGQDRFGRRASAGIYFVKVVTDKKVWAEKVVLVH